MNVLFPKLAQGTQKTPKIGATGFTFHGHTFQIWTPTMSDGIKSCMSMAPSTANKSKAAGQGPPALMEALLPTPAWLSSGLPSARAHWVPTAYSMLAPDARGQQDKASREPPIAGSLKEGRAQDKQQRALWSIVSWRGYAGACSERGRGEEVAVGRAQA